MARNYTATVFARPAGAPRAPAEVVLESSSVAHAQEVERRTLREIEEKASALRNLVGGSYRSLIGSADTILAMRAVAGSVVGSLGAMRRQVECLSLLRASAADSGPAPGTPRNAPRDSDFALGCRVKFLLDTPEILWGLLEDGERCAAAERLACARDVSALLAASSQRAAAAQRFPVLAGCAPAVEAVGVSVGGASREGLLSPLAPAARVADAAAACALLEGWPSHVALGGLLDGRRQALREELELCASLCAQAQPGSPEARQAAQRGLLAAVTAAQAALCHCGELFAEAPGDCPAALLSQALEGLPPLPSLARALPAPEPETAAWAERRRVARERLRPLPAAAIGAALRAWLAAAAADLARQAPRLLAAAVSLRGLVELEQAVRAACVEAPHALAAAAWAARMRPEHAHQPWQAACLAMLGAPLCLWGELCADSFAQRSRQVLTAQLAALPFAPAAQALLAAPPSPLPLAVQWCLPDVDPGQPTAAGGAHPAGLNQWGAPRRGPEAACVALADAHLQSLRADLVASLSTRTADAAHEHEDAHREAQQRQRVEATQAHAAAAVAEAVSAAIGELRDSVASARAAGDDTARLLLCARLAVALVETSQELPVWLGPPAAWRLPAPSLHAVGAGTASERARARRASATAAAAQPPGAAFPLAARMAALTVDALDIAGQAHRAWAAHTADALARSLPSALEGDELLTLDNGAPCPKAWEEAALRSGEDDSAELRVALPSQPSPYVSELLFSASTALLAAASGPAPPAGAVRALAGALWVRALGAFKARAAVRGSAALTERGALQLLFDIRLTADVLAAGSTEAASFAAQTSTLAPFPPRHSSAAAPAAAAGGSSSFCMQPYRADVQPLLCGLSELMDPIDWATYEPPLWAACTRCYARMGVLLGSLLSVAPLHGGAAGRLAPGADAAAAALPPPPPRFVYLPVAPPPAPPGALSARGLAASAARAGVGEQLHAASDFPSAGAEDSSALLKAFSARGISALLGEAAGGRLKAGAAGFVETAGGLLNLLGTPAL